MKTKIDTILESIECNPDDVQHFGMSAVRKIHKSEQLKSEDDFVVLKEYIDDEIAFLEVEIAHTKKYTGIVYNKNVSLSRKYEKEMLEKIRDAIQKEL